MKIFFYPSFNSKGSRTILVRTANTPIDILPETLKEHYKTVKPQEDEVNLDDLQSRWWLSKQLVDNLNTKGWDVFVLASTINFQLY